LMGVIDLRSDTVTHPTLRMRKAMATASVGDDVLGEDPTVRRLEDRAAELLGKASGLFVASGTMANQLAAMTLCDWGQEVIVADTSHIFNLEVGAVAALHGLQVRPLATDRGVFSLDRLSAAIHSAALQNAATGLLCLENTADLNRGYAVSVEATQAMAKVAHDRGVPVFLDGARIFNAATALGTTAACLAAPVDAAMFCLTKGLACPVGSVLVGDAPFITAARRNRQRLGGGWRQAGVIAAAGLVALEEMIDRLADDHLLAQTLVKLLTDAGFALDPSDCETNILHVPVPDAMSATLFADSMRSRGVLVKVIGDGAVRMVLHKDIIEEDLDRVAAAATAAARESSPRTRRAIP
jgi:threonine aldolase